MFGIDPDRNRVTWETPSSEAIPFRRKPLGVRPSYTTRRKHRYEAYKCGWTQPLFRKARHSGINYRSKPKGKDKFNNNYNTSYNHYYNITLKPKVKTIARKILAHTQMHK